MNMNEMADKIKRIRKLMKLCDNYLTTEEEKEPGKEYHMAEVPVDREDIVALDWVLAMADSFMRIRNITGAFDEEGE